ncbi:MAG: hypothetical protein Q4G60_03165 [bacterium]|nr:hypothetical protein [bacterium]
MKYDLFKKFYDEAKDYNDVDMYIAERGWQDWMDKYSPTDDASKVAEILTRIYNLSKLSIRYLRSMLGLSQISFYETYGIPRRTLQDWESGDNKVADYLVALVAYTVFEGEENE